MAESIIPIRNIYYLLCYAWDALEEGGVVDVDGLRSDQLVDLFAAILVSGVKHLARRGLDREFLVRDEVLLGIRGRIDMLGSARRLHFIHGRAVCMFDDLSINTLPNQILRSTARVLAATRGLDPDLVHQLTAIRRDMRGVEDIGLSTETFRRVQLHANNRYYRFLLHACELAFQSALVDERGDSYRFRDFLRDDRRMAKLFQSFVLNFYKHHRPELRARSIQINWNAEGDLASLAFLPRMTTDVTLDFKNATLIIDTKYYSDALSSYWNTPKVRSENLYQLLTYLSHYPAQYKKEMEGMLLYPVVDRRLRLAYRLGTFRVHVCTVDLNREWRDLKAELLGLVSELVVQDTAMPA